MYKPKANGYFSGAGGMELGLMLAGIEVQQSLELDAEAVTCMEQNRHYFDHKIIHKDIKDHLAYDDYSADIAVGTYPCTKYSPIADISGTRTGDDLFLHFFRMVALRQPECYIIENVPGMRKFPVVMEAITRLPNYYVNVICPVDANIWLPQNRKRLIVIGTKKTFFITPPAQSKRPKIRDLMEKDVAIVNPDYVRARIQGKYRDRPIVVDPMDDHAIAPTCVAHYAKDLGTRMVKDRNHPDGMRPFTIREYARLQGFPDDFQFENKLSSYRLIGNAVPVQMAEWAGSCIVNYFN